MPDTLLSDDGSLPAASDRLDLLAAIGLDPLPADSRASSVEVFFVGEDACDSTVSTEYQSWCSRDAEYDDMVEYYEAKSLFYKANIHGLTSSDIVDIVVPQSDDVVRTARGSICCDRKVNVTIGSLPRADVSEIIEAKGVTAESPSMFHATAAPP